MLILVLANEYINRFHIDIFHALRYYTKNSTTKNQPQTFSDYPLIQKIVNAIHSIANAIPQYRVIDFIDSKLRQARIPMAGGESIVVVIIVSFFVGLIVFILTFRLLIAIIIIVLVFLISALVVYMLIQKNKEIFTNQLGDCLTTVANALRAGYSFVQAMDLVSKEMKPPINEEFAHVMRDVSYGMALEQALEEMNKRVENSDFDLVVTAVLIQREIGGNLAQVLDTISETINARIRMRREILTITAQGRLSAWVLTGIPIFIALVELAANPNYFDLMLDSDVGIGIMIVTVIFEIIGFIVIRKIVNIKVH